MKPILAFLILAVTEVYILQRWDVAGKRTLLMVIFVISLMILLAYAWLKLARRSAIPTHNPHSLIPSVHLLNKVDWPVTLKEDAIGMRTTKESPTIESVKSETFEENIKKRIKGFSVNTKGSKTKDREFGLEAIAIHHSRMFIYYNDRHVFSGKLTGYDILLMGILNDYLNHLKEEFKTGVVSKAMIKIYPAYIRPITEGYERLSNRLNHQPAIDILGELVMMGKTISKLIEESDSGERSNAA